MEKTAWYLIPCKSGKTDGFIRGFQYFCRMVYPVFDGAYYLIALIFVFSGIAGYFGFRGYKGGFFLVYNFALAWHFFYHAMYYSGLIQNVPGIFLTHIITYFIGTTSFYFFYCFLFKRDFQLEKRYIVHAVLPVLVTFSVIYYLWENGYSKLTRENILRRSPEDWPFPEISQPVMGTFIVFYGILVLGLAIKNVNPAFVIKNLKSGKFPKSIQFVVLGAYLVLLLATILWTLSSGYTLFYRLLPVVMALAFFLIYFLGIVYPFALQLGFLVEVAPSFNIKQYTKSRLQNVDIVALEEKITEIMHIQKLYCEDGISIQMLAEKLGLHSLQLSEYLNVIKNQTFADFVRGWRIREARDLMFSDKTFNLTRISYECGFKSESTFFKAFRQEMGMTPREFREKFQGMEERRKSFR